MLVRLVNAGSNELLGDNPKKQICKTGQDFCAMTLEDCDMPTVIPPDEPIKRGVSLSKIKRVALARAQAAQPAGGIRCEPMIDGRCRAWWPPLVAGRD